jgi:hypothetical protein
MHLEFVNKWIRIFRVGSDSAKVHGCFLKIRKYKLSLKLYLDVSRTTWKIFILVTWKSCSLDSNGLTPVFAILEICAVLILTKMNCFQRFLKALALWINLLWCILSLSIRWIRIFGVDSDSAKVHGCFFIRWYKFCSNRFVLITFTKTPFGTNWTIFIMLKANDYSCLQSELKLFEGSSYSAQMHGLPFLFVFGVNYFLQKVFFCVNYFYKNSFFNKLDNPYYAKYQYLLFCWSLSTKRMKIFWDGFRFCQKFCFIWCKFLQQKKLVNFWQ